MADIQVNTVYTITNPELGIFDGALCLMLNKNGYWPMGTKVTLPNQYCKGVAIATIDTTSGKFTCRLDNVKYLFNAKGFPVNEPAQGYNLYAVTADKEPLQSGTVVGDLEKKTVTRMADGSTQVSTVGTMSVAVENLNARDQFAIQMLKSFMSGADNPETFDGDKISYYCDAAYKWASYLMATAASVRTIVEKEDSDSPIGPEDLASNTEVLLDSIVRALSKTIVVETEGNKEIASNSISIRNFNDLLPVMEALSESIGNQTIEVIKMRTSLSQINTTLSQIKELLDNINIKITYTE